MTVHHQGASGTHGSIRLTGKYNTPWTLSKKWIYNSATLVFVAFACSHSEQLRVQSLQIKLKIIFLTHIVSALRLRWPVVSFAFGIWRKLDSVVFSFQENKKTQNLKLMNPKTSSLYRYSIWRTYYFRTSFVKTNKQAMQIHYEITPHLIPYSEVTNREAISILLPCLLEVDGITTTTTHAQGLFVLMSNWTFSRIIFRVQFFFYQ